MKSLCSGNICAILTHTQSLLDTCYVLASSRRLKLSISKCFAMYVPAATCATPRDDLHLYQLTIDASPISWLDEMRILGVTFTTTLSLTNYANIVRSKIFRMLDILQRFGCALDGLTRPCIFQAFIQPNILFCMLVWVILLLLSATY